MKKTDAVKLIRKTFEAPFEREQFTLFLKELLNSFDESKAHKWKMVKESFSEQVASWERVGVYQKDERRIDTLIVYLKKETSLERARTMQRNFVAGYLRGDYGSTSEKHAALVAFVSADPADWRFSLVKLEYALKENEKGEIIDANGVFEEFEIAKASGLKLIPIGATGFASKKILEIVLKDYDIFFPEFPSLRTDFELLGNNSDNPNTLINTIIKIANIIRGG